MFDINYLWSMATYIYRNLKKEEKKAQRHHWLDWQWWLHKNKINKTNFYANFFMTFWLLVLNIVHKHKSKQKHNLRLIYTLSFKPSTFADVAARPSFLHEHFVLKEKLQCKTCGKPSHWGTCHAQTETAR